MKPCSRKAMPYKNLLQDVGFGSKKTIASIKGSTKKLGEKYKNCMVVLYNKANLQPLAIARPDENCEYRFLGLNNSINCFVVAFDSAKQYNAVIQDNMVPK